MPHLADISYSQETTIAAVHYYYQFLTKPYLPPSSIIEPPEGSWPQITKESIGHLGKTDEVIELLRHLPYIRDDGENETPEVAPGTRFVDWARFATRNWDREGVLLATDGDDVIYWVKCPHAIKCAPSMEPALDDTGDYAPEEELGWSADGPAWAVPDLFKQLRGEFLHLKFVPTGPREVTDDYSNLSGETGDGSTETIRKVYRDHGWPHLDRYRKEDCLKALRNTLRETYPDLLKDGDDSSDNG
ncbi:hypothetical protein JX266_013515 [Neoarthrinium moseri]|nr:hypothetical protein JX266_013515 [Neoarthrinium moseri]